MTRPVAAFSLALLLAPSVSVAQLDVEATSQALIRYPTLAPFQGRTLTSIEVVGREVTRENVVDREIRSKVGEPLDLLTVHDDVGRLRNLQIFSEIEVEGEADGPGGVRLRYVVREMPPWLPLLALTYTEENGFSVGPGLVAYNLGGRDIDVSAKAFFGGTTQYQAMFNWPWMAGSNHLGLNVQAAHRVREDSLNEFEEKSDELTPRLSRFLGEHGRIAGMFSLFVMHSDQPGKTLSPDNTDSLIRFGGSVGWDTRDDWNNPRRGWLNELEVWKTGGALGGDGDFWTVNADVRRWLPVGRRQRLLLSGLLTLQSGRVGEQIPVYLQYHLGGANTIRGYDVEVLGRRLYGKNQLLGTLEHSFTLVPTRRFDIWKLSFRLGLELALFADGGIAWSEAPDFAWRRARGGIGAGLRVLTPVSEMVRLDVGWSPEEGFHFHFAGGSKPKRQRERLR